MENKIKKILITGSSGTIGTRLFEKLLEKGLTVSGFDKKPNKWHEKLNKLTIVGDLLKKQDIEKLPKDFDLIIHLAANARVYDLVINPDLARDNIITTYNILEFARKNNINKIIFSSSRETYGNRKVIKSSEKDVDINFCESPYAASKIADEVLVYSYSKCYNMNYIVLRFSNVYGMYDQSDRFVPLVIRKMRENKTIEIFGQDKTLDFTYIDDCIDGIIKCIVNFNKIKNNAINIAFGKGEKLIAVADLIKKELKSKSKIEIRDNRTGEVVKYIADIAKAKKLLNYKPKFKVENGIKFAVKWYENNDSN